MTTDGSGMLERVVRAETEIDAPASVVWQVLTDVERYPEWNPFTVEVRSPLEPGAAVDMRVRLRGRLHRQRHTVRHVEPERALDWGMTMGRPQVLAAERTQRIEPLGAERSRYLSEDRLRGLLVPLVMGIYGTSMQQGFDAMVRALRERAEQQHRPGG